MPISLSLGTFTQLSEKQSAISRISCALKIKSELSKHNSP
jgi:hypothetical protein